ncbi:MAG: 3-mercaptopyruvate sulfurtransferase [Hoeflea sp.]|uniref:3-mercaptopyruvate sulfurtransferase n=1 Tax=Hoeflea sp. TaxID=1940281 RepID=UPI0032985A11
MITSPDRSSFVVSFDWLRDRIGQPGLKIVDASWYLPNQNRDAAQDYAMSRIPGAVFFDQDEIVDTASGLPHTIAGPEQFSRAVGKLGLTGTDTIVVYDGPGMFTAPRVWWLLRLFGASNVFVLDGGFDSWKDRGLPTETGTPETPEAAVFNATRDGNAVTGFDAMRSIVDSKSSQIADARGPGRFEGTEPEPRAGMRSGHMPGARNIPFQALSEGGKLKPVNELREILESSGLDLNRPVVTTCGSGVTAAVITLALQSIGHRDNTLYDGSWSEWGGRNDTPIVTGSIDDGEN